MDQDTRALLELCKKELSRASELKGVRIIETLEERLNGSPTPSIAEPSATAAAAAGPSNDAGSAGKKRTKSAAAVACILCRRCKTKCIFSDPGAGRCDRCIVTGTLARSQNAQLRPS